MTVAAGAAHRLLEFSIGRGADRATLLRRSGIRPDNLADHDGRVPLDNYIALMRAAKELCGDPALPLHFAEAVDMSEFSVVGLLGHASLNMMEAFAQLNRYGRLVLEVDVGGSERFELVRARGKLWVVDNRLDPNRFPELTEATFARMVCGTRRFGVTRFVTEVHVTHTAPDHSEEYRQVFQAPVTFASDWNAMAVDEKWLAHPVSLQPRYVFGILTAHADGLLAELSRSKTVKGEVENILLPMLHTGNANAAAVAARMGVSRQTLYRRLRQESTSFEKVLEELRRKMAISYLQGGKVSGNEIAYLVGFSDHPSFTRAFRRWTGKTPREWRNSALRADHYVKGREVGRDPP